MDRVVFTFDDMIASLRKAMGRFQIIGLGKIHTMKSWMQPLERSLCFLHSAPGFFTIRNSCNSDMDYQTPKTLFGIYDIPSDNHIRNLLDEITPTLLSSVLADCFKSFNNLLDFMIEGLKKPHDLETLRFPV